MPSDAECSSTGRTQSVTSAQSLEAVFASTKLPLTVGCASFNSLEIHFIGYTYVCSWSWNWESSRLVIHTPTKLVFFIKDGSIVLLLRVFSCNIFMTPEQFSAVLNWKQSISIGNRSRILFPDPNCALFHSKCIEVDNYLKQVERYVISIMIESAIWYFQHASITFHTYLHYIFSPYHSQSCKQSRTSRKTNV